MSARTPKQHFCADESFAHNGDSDNLETDSGWEDDTGRCPGSQSFRKEWPTDEFALSSEKEEGPTRCGTSAWVPIFEGFIAWIYSKSHTKRRVLECVRVDGLVG